MPMNYALITFINYLILMFFSPVTAIGQFRAKFYLI